MRCELAGAGGGDLVEEGAGGGAGIADEVREADAAIAVAKQGEVAEVFNAQSEFGDAVDMADLILWEAARPAADGGEFGGGVG